jgi:prophage regulatory protein
MSPATKQHLPPMLRLGELEAGLGVSRITIWAWRKAGRFPEPVMLSAGCIRWRSSDVELWLKARKTADVAEWRAQAVEKYRLTRAANLAKNAARAVETRRVRQQEAAT